MRAVLGALPEAELAQERQRARLIASVPELRARALDNLALMLEPFTALLAERVGRSPSDPAVRTFTGALMGVSIAATLEAIDDPDADYFELIDGALARLEAGLPL